MTDLFDEVYSAITGHFSNVLEEGALEESVVRWHSPTIEISLIRHKKTKTREVSLIIPLFD